MNARPGLPIQRELSTVAAIGVVALYALWRALRLPVFAMLRLAEPLVRLTLGALGLLSILGALFYQVASSLPHPPVLSLLGFGVGCGLALLLYRRLLRLFS
jgi:hypothetical protein